MSQSGVQTAPAPTAAPIAAQPPQGEVAAAQIEPKKSTPHQLGQVSLGLVVTGILVGLLGGVIFSFLAYSLHRAEDDANQLIRVQKIQTNLLGADATATNAFLVGGLEPASQRATYDQAITATGALIAEAAQAQPADGQALAALNQQVIAYAATIEQARANNRQGFPVGAQYLRTASAELRSDALPILDNLVRANAERAYDEMNLRIGYIFIVITVLALAAAVFDNLWLSRRFKRTLNVGVLSATLLLLLALLVGSICLFQVRNAVAEVRTGSFADLNAASRARIQANDAKSNESLTLIARGSGSAFEAAWVSSAEEVERALATLPDQNALSDAWTAYTAIHQKIRSQDDGGSWDSAVATATGSGKDSSNTAFNAFDAQLASYLDGVSSETGTSLASRQPVLVVAAVLTLLAGLGAALLGRRGVGERLREYR